MYVLWLSLIYNCNSLRCNYMYTVQCIRYEMQQNNTAVCHIASMYYKQFSKKLFWGYFTHVYINIQEIYQK